MKSLTAWVLCAAAFAAAAPQDAGKPSPIPRRPVRPKYVESASSARRAKGDSERSVVREGAPDRVRSAVVSPVGSQNFSGTRETGVACFFSSGVNGAVTASGSRLNSEDLVAGHPRFPMGSWVSVKNLANGKTVTVQVVDRFPQTTNRVINLSEAAARKLEFVRAGSAQVEVTAVDGPQP
jgi:rare lipoprotein A